MLANMLLELMEKHIIKKDNLMKKLIFILALCLIIRCKIQEKQLISRTYISSCYLYSYPSVILKIYNKNSFEYNLAYLDEKIVGNWTIRKDTLILTSDYFTKQLKQELTPSYKCTGYSQIEDAFLIRGKKLYEIDNLKKVNRSCFLKSH